MVCITTRLLIRILNIISGDEIQRRKNVSLIICSHYQCPIRATATVIGFYRDDQLDIANENMRTIESDDFGRKSESFSIKLRTPDGQRTFDQSCGWKGYFESLDHVDLVGIQKIKV